MGCPLDPSLSEKTREKGEMVNQLHSSLNKNTEVALSQVGPLLSLPAVTLASFSTAVMSSGRHYQPRSLHSGSPVCIFDINKEGLKMSMCDLISSSGETQANLQALRPQDMGSPHWFFEMRLLLSPF